MTQPTSKPLSRIQRANRELIRIAALEAFTLDGLRGVTLDKIAELAGMTKPNILYYYAGKDAIYSDLLENLLEEWLLPLRDISPDGEALDEILKYVRKKLHMSMTKPRESKLFATEILHGAPLTSATLSGSLKELVDEKAALIEAWVKEGKLAPIDPYHLIFSIWAMTQHYADFDVQVDAILPRSKAKRLHEEAEMYFETLFTRLLTPGGS
jgi:TetR/AcrR family transcriptional regulator